MGGSSSSGSSSSSGTRQDGSGGASNAQALAVYVRPHQYPWLDDFNDPKPIPPLLPGQADCHGQPFPKTLGSGPLTAEEMAGYTAFTFKNSSMANVASAQQKYGSNHPLFWLWVSSRAYQGSKGGISQGPNFESDGPTSVGTVASGAIFPGHWAYVARTTLTAPVAAAQMITIQVANLDAGTYTPGRYIRLMKKTAQGIDWASTAAFQIDSVTGNQIKATLHGKSKPMAFASGDYVYGHAIGQVSLEGYPHFWAWNIATTCPRDGQGRNASEFLADWLAKHKNRTSNGSMSTAKTHGYVSDADGWTVENPLDADLDGDDDKNGINELGEPLWGNGQTQFYVDLRNAWPEAAITSGTQDSPVSPGADGNQLEAAPNLAYGDSTDPNYAAISKHIINAQIHLRYNGGGANTNHFYSKILDQQYPYGATTGLEWTHAEFGGALAGALGVYFGRKRTEGEGAGPNDTWYDFYAVDVGQGTFTQGPKPDKSYGYGVSIPLTNYADRVKGKGWLGQPLGLAYRVYDGAAFADGAEVWKWNTQIDPTGAEMETSKAAVTVEGKELHVKAPVPFVDGLDSAYVRTKDNIPLASGAGVTVAMKIRSAPNQWRRLGTKIGGLSVKHGIGWESRWYVVSGKVTDTSGASKLTLACGQHKGVDFFIEEVRVFSGSKHNANVFGRDFDHGSVFVNATPTAVTIPLQRSYVRYTGYQNPANDGQPVTGSITLAPHTGVYLIHAP